MKFKVEILSPVMIWSGFDADVVFDMHYYEGHFKVVDHEKLKNHPRLKELINNISGRLQPRDYLLLYKKVLGEIPDIYTSILIPVDEGTTQPNNIKTLVKTKNGYPYIPGSSIKGAIKASYLWEMALQQYGGAESIAELYNALSLPFPNIGRDKLTVRDSSFISEWRIGKYQKYNQNKRGWDGGFYSEYIPPNTEVIVEIEWDWKGRLLPSLAHLPHSYRQFYEEKTLKDVLQKVDAFSRQILNYIKEKMPNSEELISILEDQKGYLILLGSNKPQPPKEIRLSLEKEDRRRFERKNRNNPRRRWGRWYRYGLSTLYTAFASSPELPIGIARLVPLDNENQD